MSDSVQPHRRQPIRLPCPWDSPSKNTGVGCHFLLQCMKVKSESEVAQSCQTLNDLMHCSLPGSSVHGIFQARVLEWVAIAFSSRGYTYTYSCTTYLDKFHLLMGFLSGSAAKNLPANSGDAGDMSSIPGSGRSPGIEMATHSSTLAWKIPWTEEPGGLKSMGSQESDTT